MLKYCSLNIHSLKHTFPLVWHHCDCDITMTSLNGLICGRQCEVDAGTLNEPVLLTALAFHCIYSAPYTREILCTVCMRRLDVCIGRLDVCIGYVCSFYLRLMLTLFVLVLPYSLFFFLLYFLSPFVFRIIKFMSVV